MKNPINKRGLLSLAGICMAGGAFAQDTTAAGGESLFSNYLFLGMLTLIVCLLLVIAVLGSVVTNMAEYKYMNKASKMKPLLWIAIAIGGLGSSSPAFAQDTATAAVAADNTIGGLNPVTFYMLLLVIFTEVFTIGVFLNIIRKILNQLDEKKAAAALAMKEGNYEAYEAAITLDHEYDGIRELDNNLPSWWKYMFYATIVFAVIYLFYYHVFYAGPLQTEEYQTELAVAAARKASNLASSGAKIDENSVVLLTDEADLGKGKNTYVTSCAACHGAQGEGGVGPNLTDDYWLHGGSVKDIFRTITNGVPEKGMISWKASLNPTQIQQVTSYVKSLHGSKPANGKDPQGTLYTEEPAADAEPAADSTATASK